MKLKQVKANRDAGYRARLHITHQSGCDVRFYIWSRTAIPVGAQTNPTVRDVRDMFALGWRDW